MDGEVQFKYFKDVVARIYGRLGCINDVTDFNYRLIMLGRDHWKLIARFKGNVVCVVSFHINNIFNLNNILVEVYDNLSRINVFCFKCDFLSDPLAEDKVVRYLIDNYGKYFVV